MYAQEIYQSMFYALNYGKKISALQVLLGHSIYEKSKSREALTQLNSVSFSVSCNQVMKFRSNLCAYTLNTYKDEYFTPHSHLNTSDFMIGAFDNFNHRDASSLSGSQATNDTVLVLFQNKNDIQLLQFNQEGKP